MKPANNAAVRIRAGEHVLQAVELERVRHDRGQPRKAAHLSGEFRFEKVNHVLGRNAHGGAHDRAERVGVGQNPIGDNLAAAEFNPRRDTIVRRWRFTVDAGVWLPRSDCRASEARRVAWW